MPWLFISDGEIFDGTEDEATASYLLRVYNMAFKGGVRRKEVSQQKYDRWVPDGGV